MKNNKIVAAQKENAELRDSLKEFDRQLRIHERRLGLLRTYDEHYVTDLGLTTLLDKDLFKSSKDPAISEGREDISYIEDARGLQIFQKCRSMEKEGLAEDTGNDRTSTPSFDVKQTEEVQEALGVREDMGYKIPFANPGQTYKEEPEALQATHASFHPSSST